jgi:nucleotide-binding universal stress UspA family protein
MEGAAIKELRVTLFCVMGAVPSFLRREAQANPHSLKQLKTLEAKNRETATDILEKAKKRLLDHGLKEDMLQIKAQPRASGLARDILFEAEHGIYDAVVLGRRSLSKAQELFLGSVTNKIVQHAQRLPVWIIGGRITSLKVLCAVDGSEGALKAVDHMAFMLGENPECEITLFHVGATLANYCTLDFGEKLKEEIEGDIMHSDSECMDDFYSRAIKILTESGLSPDQIETKSVESVSVPRAILKEASQGDYGTVVVGRRGESRSFFLGHVSDKVLSRSEEAAVWIVG